MRFLKIIIMNKEHLIKLIDTHEWNDVEFKEALWKVPKSAYETVSAFANTKGGHIVFGVKQIKDTFEIAGVVDVDNIQNAFLSALRADNKVNHDISVQEDIVNINDKVVLVFYIPESTRQNKPIYLNGDIRMTYIRRGGCDQKARMSDIEKFLRDASEERWDSQIYDFPIENALDIKSIRWYRNRFYQINPGHDESQTDYDFLYEWGYLVKEGDDYKPTRAAIMLFGSPVAIHHLLPLPTLDIQWIPSRMNDPLPEIRWLDRAVYEDNLIVTWQGFVMKYYKYAQRPFNGIDPHTLMRNDTPPDYRVVREAAINLLIHQDYNDHSRKAVIKFYKDCIQFWNPGDVFGSEANLFEPGEKELRNPRIATAFRRLALCEQAGTGLRMMKKQWQTLGNPDPCLINDPSQNFFEFQLIISKHHIIDHYQMKDERRKDINAEIGGEVGGEVSGEVGGEVSGEVKDSITRDVFKTLSILQKNKPMTRKQLQETLNIKSQDYFRKHFLNPSQQLGLIDMTIPDKPRSSKQKYQLTKKGRMVLKQVNTS